MAASQNTIILFAILSVIVLLPTATTATQYVVGDDSGWTINYDYQAWAKDKVFNVGDTLVFNYPKGLHNVFKVNATSFANCTIPPINEALTSGHDVITLAAPGKKWYICGVANHCADFGQKLVINVEGGWSPAPAPSAATKYGYQAFMAIVVGFAVVAMV